MKHPGMLGFPSYLCQIQASEHTSITSGERMEDHKTCYGLYGQTCPRLLQKALPCEPCIKALLPFILTATAKLACQVKADFSQFPPPHFACCRDRWGHGEVNVAIISSTWMFCFPEPYIFSAHCDSTSHHRNSECTRRPNKCSRMNRKEKQFSIWIAGPAFVCIYLNQDCWWYNPPAPLSKS